MTITFRTVNGSVYDLEPMFGVTVVTRRSTSEVCNANTGQREARPHSVVTAHTVMQREDGRVAVLCTDPKDDLLSGRVEAVYGPDGECDPENLWGIYPTPCEHGLSRWLCAGPGHYPADNDYPF